MNNNNNLEALKERCKKISERLREVNDKRKELEKELGEEVIQEIEVLRKKYGKLEHEQESIIKKIESLKDEKLEIEAEIEAMF